jgi:hypothetical protein
LYSISIPLDDQGAMLADVLFNPLMQDCNAVQQPGRNYTRGTDVPPITRLSRSLTSLFFMGLWACVYKITTKPGEVKQTKTGDCLARFLI